MTIKAVVFDLDGTLAEFNLDYKAVRAEALQFLTHQGFPASIFSTNERIFEMLKKAEVYMRNHNGKEQGFLAIQEHVLSIAREHEVKAARETSLLPGVLEMLKALSKMNLKLAIFTISSEKSAHYILSNFRVKQFFDAIIAREAVSEVKPNPLHLAAALRALNVSADETVVVGDNPVDMRGARALNVEAIGVTADPNTAKTLNHAGATHIIESITDLPTLITKLSKHTF